MGEMVLKYDLALGGVTLLSIPSEAKILSSQLQYDMPRLWVLADTEKKEEDRQFVIFGTGHVIHFNKGGKYNFINTILMGDGELVLHIFEIL